MVFFPNNSECFFVEYITLITKDWNVYLPNKKDIAQLVFKQSTPGLNSVSFLLNWLPYQE